MLRKFSRELVRDVFSGRSSCLRFSEALRIETILICAHGSSVGITLSFSFDRWNGLRDRGDPEASGRNQKE
jgi:hypothetical protein